MPKIALLIFLAAIFFCSDAYAASAGQPAYRKLEFYRTDTAGLGLRLAYDEELCKKRYGQKWQARCAAMPGRYGEIAKGVSMRPQAAGSWQWTGPFSLEFIPAKPDSLKPDTSYDIDVSGLFLPSSIQLDKKRLSFHTWPFAAQLLNLQFMPDPSPQGRHMLLLGLKFNYPAPDNLRMPEPVAPGMELGSPEIVWNNNRMELNMAWPVRKLADTEGIARINCGKIAQIQESGEGYRLSRPGVESGSFFSLPLPASQSLFKIKNVALAPALNENLDQECELEIESTLYASPDKVLESLVAIQLPEKNSPEAIDPYNWELSPGISAEDLKKGKILKLATASGKLPKSKFAFRMRPDSGSYVLVAIDKNLKSASGLNLGHNFVKILRAPARQASMEFLQPGNILPLDKSGSLALYAANLDQIHWRLRKVADPFLALMANGQYIFENSSASGVMDMDSVSESLEGVIKLPAPGDGKAQYASLNMAEELKKLAGSPDSGLALLSLRGLRKGREEIEAERLILATRLGLMLKQSANGAYDCFAQDLRDGAPAAGAEIRILGANGKTLASGNANGEGHFRSPALGALKREQKPMAALASWQGQLAWLPLNDPARKVNFSEFKTDGITSFANGLNAFIFGERGIYRPGEKLNFGIIVKNGDFSPLANDIPIWTEIIDPAGRRVHGATLLLPRAGLAEASWQAPEGATGGKYVFNARTGRDGAIIGSQTARVEEFQPDSLKLQILAPEYKGWLNSAENGAKLRFRLANLHGTPAKGHKIAASINALPAKFQFKGYEEYIFCDPAPLTAENLKRDLPETLSDENGEASLALPEDFLRLPSALARVTAEGFEAGGGRAVTQTASFLISPAEKLLGFRPGGAAANPQFIPAGAKAKIDLLALDSGLRKVEWNNLDFALSRKEYATSLVSDSTGGYRYDETPLVQPFKTWRASLPAEGMGIDLPTEQPGEYLLSISCQGKPAASMSFAVVGEKSFAPGQVPPAAKLRAHTDKTAYNAGEKAQIALSLPYDGSGLISLERDGVEAFARFTAKAGETVQELEIPANFEGKGYIVVSYARAADSPAIFMNPHACAVLPIMANMEKRDMGLKISAPESVAPGSALKVELSSRNAGKALLFAVDEGIHLLTNYQQPRPLQELLGNRGLNVASIQAYDLLMPVNLRLRNSAFGGGLDAGAFGQKFRNPFKRRNEPPLVFWSGIIDVGPQGRSLEIPVPSHYTGNARIYAVGVAETGAGSASASTLVSAPLILSPALPLALAPGDVFEGSLSIENTTGHNCDVTLAASIDGGLELNSALPAKLSIPAQASVLLPLKATASAAPGLASLHFQAESAGAKYARDATISIRPASIHKTTFIAGSADKSTVINANRKVYTNGASNKTLLSPLPLPLANGFRQYLEFYPHGCTEQLTSRAFTMLSSRNWFENSKNLEKQIMTALGAIRSRAGHGGVALWPGGEPDLLLTVYAADFLLSLHAAGIGNTQDLLEQLCDAIQEQATLNSSSLSDARTVAYGIWVLSRAGRITTQLMENLLLSLEQRLTDNWQRDLTSALLAASMKEMRINRNLPPYAELEYENDGWLDEYAQKALHFYILARSFPEALNDARRDEFFEATREVLNSGNFATFSASQGARALLESGIGKPASMLEAKISCLDNAAEPGQCRLLANGAAMEYETAQCGRLQIGLPENGGQFFWQMAISGYDSEPNQAAAENGIGVERSYLNRNGEKTLNFRQGEEITVLVEARATVGPIRDCAIVDLFPGGAELLPERPEDARLPEKAKYADRQEDRIVFYTDLDSEPVKFAYRVRAASKGSFLAPATRAEAMYAPAIFGQTAAEKLLIQ